MPERAPRHPETEPRRVIGSAHSEGGPFRHQNEDVAFFDPASGAGGVFDGVGGQPGGAIAARLAQETIQQRFSRWPAQLSQSAAKQTMEADLVAARERIWQEQPAQPHLARMNTTGCVAKFFLTEAGSPAAMIGSVGDSRAYRQLSNGSLEHLTLDDSLLFADKSEAVARRLQAHYARAASEKAAESIVGRGGLRLRHVITNSLSDLIGRPQIVVVPAQLNERIILATDGVTGNLSDSELEDILRAAPDSAAAAQAVVRAAIANSQKEGHWPQAHDNASAVVMAWQQP